MQNEREDGDNDREQKNERLGVKRRYPWTMIIVTFFQSLILYGLLRISNIKKSVNSAFELIITVSFNNLPSSPIFLSFYPYFFLQIFSYNSNWIEFLWKSRFIHRWIRIVRYSNYKSN